jgi:hypothetical protein
MLLLTGAVVTAEELVGGLSTRLAEYLPGADTGQPEFTDKRTCWTKMAGQALASYARALGVDTRVDEHSEFGERRQYNAFWIKGDAAILAITSAWGDREELERSFHRLLLVKAPQKLLLYTCAKWQDAVLDQLAGAVLRYPHHLEGEEYIAANLIGAERKTYGTTLNIPHSGLLKNQETVFRPIAGSPFAWRS